jgi:hypothetical protein
MPPGVELAAAYVSITPSAKGIAAELQRELGAPVDKAAKDAGDTIEQGIGGGASRGAQAARAAISVLGSAAVLSGLNRAKDAASDLQQAVGGSAAVFGEFGSAVEDAAERSAESFGLSERAFREMTSQIGASLKGYGFAVDEAAEKSVELTELGADLAATFGGTTADAVAALSSALRGEFDPLERYGIALRQSAIDAKAVELGLAASTTNVDAHARAQAALALITEQSADAQGQFARESDSAAGQAQIAQAKIEDAAANLGEAILPIYAQLASTVGTLADVFAALPESAQKLLLLTAGVAAVAGPLDNLVDLYRNFIPLQTASTAATTANAVAMNSAAAVNTLYAVSTTRAAVATRLLNTTLKVGAAALAGYAIAAGVVGESRRRATESGEGLASQFQEEFASAESYQQRVAILNQRISEYNDVVNDANSGVDIFNNDDLATASRQIGPLIEQEIALVGVIEEYGRAGGNANEATRILGTNYERVTQLLEDGLTPAQIVATVEAEALADQEQETSAAVARVSASAEDQQRALEALVESMSDYITEAFASQDATLQWEAALDGLTESIAEHGVTLDLDTEAGRANFEQGREVADGLVTLMQRRFEETGSIQAAIDAGNLYVEQLRIQLRESGLTEAQVESYITTLNLTPRDIATNFTANTAEAVRQIQAIQRALAGVPEGVNIDVDYAQRGGGPRAAGGPVSAGTIYPVGEIGPELFVPGENGRILSKQDSMMAVAMGVSNTYAQSAVAPPVSAPSSWGSSDTFNFNGPTDPDWAAAAFRREKRRSQALIAGGW